MEKDNRLENMTAEELKLELERTKDCLADIEDMHSYTFEKTPSHIGAEKAENIQSEFEEECGKYNEQIDEIEKVLKSRGAL